MAIVTALTWVWSSMGSGLSSRPSPTGIKLVIQNAGRTILAQTGREAVLGAGEFAFLDSSQPYSVHFDDEAECTVLKFPRHLLLLPDRALYDVAAVTFGSSHPLSSAISSFASNCTQVMHSLPNTVSRRLAHNIVDLLGTAIVAESYEQPHSNRKEKLQRVLTYIESNLHDPNLTPQSIVSAQFMSVRTLHQPFEGSGQTVAGKVRSMRLERCRAELESPEAANQSLPQLPCAGALRIPLIFRVRSGKPLVNPHQLGAASRSPASSIPAQPLVCGQGPAQKVRRPKNTKGRHLQDCEVTVPYAALNLAGLLALRHRWASKKQCNKQHDYKPK